MIIVGGLAAQLHGASRMTKDVDLCPQAASENLQRLATALNQLGAHLRLLKELGDVEVPASPEILENFRASPWRTGAGDLDVLLDVLDEGGRVRYEDLIRRAVDFKLPGLETPITGASIGDLISMKHAANRPKDRRALVELERIAAEQQRGQHRAPMLKAPDPGRRRGLAGRDVAKPPRRSIGF